MPHLEPLSGTDYYLWNYVPNKVAALIFTALFIITTVLVIVRAICSRTAFCIPCIIGGVFEIIGYIARIIARNHTSELGPYVIQSILILVAPALFAASIYMTLGRTIRSVQAEHLSFIRVKWLTRIFVMGDCFSFLVQAAGAGLEANRNFNMNTAKDIILAGLVIQIIMFGLFWATAVVFQLRMARHPTPASTYMGSRKDGSRRSGMPRWRRNLYMMYGTCLMIMVRSIFRVIEYAMGQHGYPLENEWTLYVFDATLMFLTTVLFGVWYPGRMQAPTSEPWVAGDLPSSADTMLPSRRGDVEAQAQARAQRWQPMGVAEGRR